jgi:hypothetical protein
MKRVFLFAATMAAVASLAVSAQEAAKGTSFGDGVKLTISVKVADLLAEPGDYVGKTVRVDGTVRAVCQNMGCWIQIADDEKSDGIQFKVDDGVIVFPKDAKGKRASAEGTFERIATGDAHEPELAKDAVPAKEATPAKAPEYRIKATGAVIY